ncbi:MAG: hypothetical protein IT376_20970 [Polyangiaceae bacterium]|nr:hypothetical protein [Polyangiaceae bacterium]
MSRRRADRAAALGALALAACDVRALDPGRSPVDAGGDGACGRGVAVISIGDDYQSANVSALGVDGAVLSGSLLSSASRPPGLVAPLGGDAVLPSLPQRGGRIAVIDRYPSGVVTWIDLATASVPAQLDVRTGFTSNPHDLVEVAQGKAYVTRYERNHRAGREPHDAGDDLLIVDPSVPRVLGRVDLVPAMAGREPFLPRPDRAVLAGGRVLVVLAGYTADFADAADGRVVAIDPATDSIDEVLVLPGLRGCAGAAVSPTGAEIAVSCPGLLLSDSLDDSAIVRVRVEPPLTEIARYPASTLGAGKVGFRAAYASGGLLLTAVFGREASPAAPALEDSLVELDLGGGTARELLRSSGAPFTLGDPVCLDACGVCFAPDAGRRVVHRLAVGEATVDSPVPLPVEEALGLRPRQLGAL